jgi:ABC-type sugar transport system permease subunit
VFIGLGNFTRIVEDPALRGPLVDIFVWTVMFALLSVLTTFSLGLMMALVLNDPIIPARKAIRSLLLIPYAIPGVISIVVWAGMLNRNLGIINEVFNTEVYWLSDVFWSKVAIILVNLWLGYPYMMLICSGALQAIPSEVYEAASVDGASAWQKFWNITLPLLLVAVGPLLIGSFVYNFNNYLLITALTNGNPPIAGSPIPGVGYTDILISYVYKSAFSNQADYGYASAVTIIIFLMVASITLIQYRFTQSWEKVSENV